LERIPYVILLGIFCGLVSLYFTRAMNSVEGVFGKLNNPYNQIDQQQIAITIKHGVVHHRIPFGCGSSVQQQLNRIVSFTVERRGKEKKKTHKHTAPFRFISHVP